MEDIISQELQLSKGPRNWDATGVNELGPSVNRHHKKTPGWRGKKNRLGNPKAKCSFGILESWGQGVFGFSSKMFQKCQTFRSLRETKLFFVEYQRIDHVVFDLPFGVTQPHIITINEPSNWICDVRIRMVYRDLFLNCSDLKTFKSHTYQYTVSNTYSFHMNKLITSTSLYQAFRNTDFTICWASIPTFLQEVQGSWPQRMAKNDHQLKATRFQSDSNHQTTSTLWKEMMRNSKLMHKTLAGFFFDKAVFHSDTYDETVRGQKKLAPTHFWT